MRKAVGMMIVAIGLVFIGWYLHAYQVHAQSGAQRIVFDSNPKDGTCPSNTVAVEPYDNPPTAQVIGWSGSKSPIDGIKIGENEAVIFNNIRKPPICISK